MSLSPREILKGRNILFIGGTGFLGKVALSLLLDRFPEIGKVYMMVRAGSSLDSLGRFWNNIFPSPAFDPLRKRYGRAVLDYLNQKLVIIGGDITQPNLGFVETDAQHIADNIDVVLNCSGNVSFNPPLETALRTNVSGTKNLLAFVKRMRRPAFVHTSTCFVAGNVSGLIWEEDPVIGYFPRQRELKGVQFSVAQELKDCDRLIRCVREEAHDATLSAEFRLAARERLIEEGRDPDDENSLSLVAARARKDWIQNRMAALGIERATWWGWPNIYTYTKSMGEQLIAAETGIIRSIVRPSIVESAVEFPFPGWNEGFNTTAPLILFALNGQSIYPVNEKIVLDIVPVDYVASALLTITAQACAEEPELVHQLCSGDTNPNRLRRIVAMLGVYKRKHFQTKESGDRFLSALAARMEARPMDDEFFRKVAPIAKRTTQKVSDLLDRTKQYGPWSGLRDTLNQAVKRLDAFVTEGLEAYKRFRPFTVENEYRFRADNVRHLFSRLSAEDRALLTWAPESIDWYHYWMNIHFPGLKKWVFRKMEEIGKPKQKRIYTYRNLLDMFDAVTKLHAHKVAMRMERNGQAEEYTYADLHELVIRAASYLYGEGVNCDERIGLMAENSPEWGLSYFGILKAGATCVPIDKESTTNEIMNVLRSGHASGLIISDKVLSKHRHLKADVEKHGLKLRIWRTSEVFELRDEVLEKQWASKLPHKGKPTGIASIIFTSGTTGNPKGVMLTHKNLTTMVAQLLKVYDVDDKDGFLSVLPMHHTFEFSTGFLLPFNRGAQITYLEELNGEAIASALNKNHVTIIVGVPALWDLLRRRILSRLGEKSKRLEDSVKTLIRLNSTLREETSVNLGPLLFFPVHKALGGKIRYLISGGSALSEKVFQTFHGLGFSLNEGYGLTEASPVLTVTRPRSKPIAGSVGEPLPGVEIKIFNANEQGIGEVIARGPNIMAGYYENKSATDATIVEDWLHTGDLGYLDEAGNLFLVGRSKDLIVGADGKNVYPDELEELYRHHALIKELSIVGVPSAEGERVACVVVPDYQSDVSLAREQVQALIAEHFRTISAALPLYKRVRQLEFSETELPRTGTRKVKRREVVTTLQSLLSHRNIQPVELIAREDLNRLAEIVGQVAGKPTALISRHTTFDELGFDSLMYAELGVALEASGIKLPSFNGLSAISNVKELADFLQAPVPAIEKPSKKSAAADELKIPPLLSKVGTLGLDLAQQFLYKHWMRCEIIGQANTPPNVNFIIAANHCSHLDAGLVKTALGEAGREMVTLAAADYFFADKYVRAFFENFTNLLPLERKGPPSESLKLAIQSLRRAHNLLIFPEGMRSVTGVMGEFKFSLGYLALEAQKGILPVHLRGTYESLPKGSLYPRPRDLSATIGPFLVFDTLRELTKGMPKNQAYRLITQIVQKMVQDLRDGVKPAADLAALKKQWQTKAIPVSEDASNRQLISLARTQSSKAGAKA